MSTSSGGSHPRAGPGRGAQHETPAVARTATAAPPELAGAPATQRDEAEEDRDSWLVDYAMGLHRLLRLRHAFRGWLRVTDAAVQTMRCQLEVRSLMLDELLRDAQLHEAADVLMRHRYLAPCLHAWRLLAAQGHRSASGHDRREPGSATSTPPSVQLAQLVARERSGGGATASGGKSTGGSGGVADAKGLLSSSGREALQGLPSRDLFQVLESDLEWYMEQFLAPAPAPRSADRPGERRSPRTVPEEVPASAHSAPALVSSRSHASEPSGSSGRSGLREQQMQQMQQQASGLSEFVGAVARGPGGYDGRESYGLLAGAAGFAAADRAARPGDAPGGALEAWGAEGRQAAAASSQLYHEQGDTHNSMYPAYGCERRQEYYNPSFDFGASGDGGDEDGYGEVEASAGGLNSPGHALPPVPEEIQGQWPECSPAWQTTEGRRWGIAKAPAGEPSTATSGDGAGWWEPGGGVEAPAQGLGERTFEAPYDDEDDGEWPIMDQEYSASPISSHGTPYKQYVALPGPAGLLRRRGDAWHAAGS
ncbi:hypothetical protein GPECTOR_26g594 [Gonium pectorale]|uniref:Uncharacterized protein n=1 Tax=Gonium pectorale TaxID=33097 RepID=A0A150GFS2_GONPE|nr:hypothetical protein GPECTOR_26g594 [Gonium pectorale]|eukprot:KXZ48691.1 hypothetical protein GPECTOR_26g594 [Gonium pectorale]